MSEFSKEHERKLIWKTTRSVLETDNYKHKPTGKKFKSHWTAFHRIAYIFGFLCKIFFLYERGKKNAFNVQINEVDFYFDDLPSNFDDYTILHLSDLHLDSSENLDEILVSKLKNLKYDLCVITGDYRKETHGEFKQIEKPLKNILKNIHAKDGILAILGNHDSYLMADILENLNIKVLINETHSIERSDQSITFTGIDDPFYYFTEQAFDVLEKEIKDTFKIALIHTPELYEITEKNNFRLYLCGHTHGGQICLPGKIPIITHYYGIKKFFRGKWKYKRIQGYTNQGLGTVVIPIRFNSESEAALIKLKRNV